MASGWAAPLRVLIWLARGDGLRGDGEVSAWGFGGQRRRQTLACEVAFEERSASLLGPPSLCSAVEVGAGGRVGAGAGEAAMRCRAWLSWRSPSRRSGSDLPLAGASRAWRCLGQAWLLRQRGLDWPAVDVAGRVVG